MDHVLFQPIQVHLTCLCHPGNLQKSTTNVNQSFHQLNATQADLLSITHLSTPASNIIEFQEAVKNRSRSITVA
jgi:hypothetical protein